MQRLWHLRQRTAGGLHHHIRDVGLRLALADDGGCSQLRRLCNILMTVGCKAGNCDKYIARFHFAGIIAERTHFERRIRRGFDDFYSIQQLFEFHVPFLLIPHL